MSISHKVEVGMDYEAHVWACKFPKFTESVVNCVKSGWDDDYYNGYIFFYVDSFEIAEEADYLLTNLVAEYELLYKQSLAKEMTLADIERILGHPVKIIK
jgi:hypothetical protein